MYFKNFYILPNLIRNYRNSSIRKIQNIHMNQFLIFLFRKIFKFFKYPVVYLNFYRAFLKNIVDFEIKKLDK